MKLRWILAALTLIAVLIVGAIALVIFTEPGTRWLLARVAETPQLGLSISGVSGSLWSGFAADELKYRSDLVDVDARRVIVAIVPNELLRRRVDVRQLGAEELSVAIKDTGRKRASDEFRVPDVPVDVVLRQVAVERLEISAPGFEERADNIRIEGQLIDNRVDLRQLSLLIREISINAGLRLALQESWPIRLEIQWDAPELGLSGQGEASGTRDAVEIDLELLTPDLVRVRGNLFSPLDAVRYAVTVDADRFTVPAGEKQLAIANLAVAANGDLEAAELTSFTVDVAGGTITGRGGLGLTSPYPINFAVNAKNIDPSFVVPELEGRVDLAADLAGTIEASQTLTVRELEGRLADYRITGNLRAQRDGDSLRIDDARLALGDNRLNFSGALAPQLAGQFELAGNDLSQILPTLGGQLTARGRFAGTRARPVADATGTAAQLTVGARAINDLGFALRITPAGAVEARLDAKGISDGGTALGDALVELDGSLERHRISAQLDNGPIAASFAGEGRYTATLLEQRVTSARIELGELGSWTLETPAAVQLQTTSGNFRVSPHCWVFRTAAACIEQTIFNEGQFTTAATLREFPVNQFNALLPEYVSVEGTIEGKARAQRSSAGFSAEAQLRQDVLTIRYTSEQNETLETAIRALALDASGSDELARLAFSAEADYRSRLAAELEIGTPLAEVRPLKGRFSGEIPDVGEIAPLIELATGLQDARGRLIADGTIGGTLQKPGFTGGVFLTDAGALVPQSGINLENVELAIEGTDDGTASVEASARSGGGRLEAAGRLSLLDRTAALRITGQRFETLRLPDQQAVASPDISLAYGDDRIDVDGTLRMPEATFIIQAIPETAITPSGDAIDHDATEPVKRRRLPDIDGTVTVSLGDAVKFSGFGLSTNITGDLRLRQDAERRQLFADGILKFQGGRFEAYGQKLQIERGTLIFSGPIDDPKLDVRASRTIQYDGATIKAGVLLTGTASNITTRVFSEPAMSEANALSYLVIGRPIEAAGSGDSAALTNAAITMGLRQALPVLQQVGESVGLDEIGIGGDSTDETAFLAGKQINEDLSIRYTYELFSRIGTFIARYSLGRGFSIEASSGEDQALELIYSVTR